MRGIATMPKTFSGSRFLWLVTAMLMALPLLAWAQRNVSGVAAVMPLPDRTYLPLVQGSEPASVPVPAAATAFLETFDGDPASPLAWHPDNWDVTLHSRDRETWAALEPMHAGHGPHCEAPPASHELTRYEQSVFICRNHLMTAINAAGYGVIYLTPNHLVDFSQGEAVVRFDVSTARSSPRDWIDLWITPYEDNLQLALDSWLPDMNGEPRRSVHVVMDFSEISKFKGEIIRDFEVFPLAGTPQSWLGYESFLTPSATRRDTFELRISNSHIKFGMPDYDFWWLDTAIEPLGWTQGVLQLGHHSYNPRKDCPTCAPNTWHWDNVSIEPAVPFTLLRADRRYVDQGTAASVTFAAPAPANAHLRFAGIGSNVEVTFDNGATWQPAQIQVLRRSADEHFKSYWMPVPAGTTAVTFRGAPWWGAGWHVRDISIWAPPE
jgi:hypothetical protein